MASDQTFVDHVCEQAGLGALLSYRKMFGEYALYLDGKVVALVCDNQLFLKPTPQGRQLLGSVNEQAPFPGAKPKFLLADELDNPETLRRLFTTTAAALPPPKPKSTAKPKSGRKTRPKTKAKLTPARRP